ncbi:MAG: hypothetical protein QM668_13185 [Agriterribacter sp.]
MDLLNQIKEKSDKASLHTKLATREIKLINGDTQKRTDLFIQIPFERDFKNIVVSEHNKSLQQILESSFEKYRFIKGVEGIYSSELGVIECEIQSDNTLRSPEFILRRLAKYFRTKQTHIETENNDEKEEGNYNFYFPSPDESTKIQIGQSSTAFSFLSGNKTESVLWVRDLRAYSTIRIEGVIFETHQQAKELITTIANSVFFQIDLITNIPIHLALERGLQREIRLRRKIAREEISFSAPKFQYDFEAISLFWYARTAITMPLAQFQAFYQVIEFYFPQYSSKEAQERIKNLLKDPTFDRNSDKNVAKILEIVKVTAKGKAIGDERSQLRATVQSCVDLADLYEFFNEMDDRKDFFDDQKKGKSLVAQKISFSRKEHDIRVDVANRIYDLRCRIVHTKEDVESDLLFPFSLEVAYIKFDIDLVEFIARKVLIASGKPLNLKI